MGLLNINRANGLVFHVRVQDRSLVPVLLRVEKPYEAVQIEDTGDHYSDLGIDRVAIVHAEGCGVELRIKRITDVGMFANDDSTTSKRAIDIIVRDGHLEEFIKTSIGQVQ